MQKRIFSLIVAAFFGLVLFAALGISNAAENPDSITIKIIQDKKPPVVFPHKKHNTPDGANLKCVECHHKDADNPKACESCHSKDKDEGKKIAIKGNPPTSATKGMFHVECIGCHKKNKEKNTSTKAPTLCNGCHKA